LPLKASTTYRATALTDHCSLRTDHWIFWS
jgi:hypothetical protein